MLPRVDQIWYSDFKPWEIESKARIDVRVTWLTNVYDVNARAFSNGVFVA